MLLTADFIIIYVRRPQNGAFFVFFASSLGLCQQILYDEGEAYLGYGLILRGQFIMQVDGHETSSNLSSCEIQWDALKAAFENHSGGAKSLLDCKTGEVLDLKGDAASSFDTKTRFLSIVPVPSRTQYQMMETFIASVSTTGLKSLLLDTIVGKGAFRRFKDALSQFPEERKRWFTFRDALLHQYILDWLTENNVHYTSPPPWNLELPSAVSSLSCPTDSTDSATPQTPVANTLSDQELKTFILGWAKQHGAEFGYTFGPLVFEALYNDLKKLSAYVNQG